MSRRRAPLRHRPQRTVPAVVCAVALIAIGAALLAAAIARLSTGSTPTVAEGVGRWASGLSWADPVMLAISGVAALLGLLLVMLALVPGRRHALALAVDDTGARGPAHGEAVMPRRAVDHLVAARARLVDGVDRVDVRTDERMIKVHATTPSRYTDDVTAHLRENVEETVRSVGFSRPPQVRVSVVHREA